MGILQLKREVQVDRTKMSVTIKELVQWTKENVKVTRII